MTIVSTEVTDERVLARDSRGNQQLVPSTYLTVLSAAVRPQIITNHRYLLKIIIELFRLAFLTPPTQTPPTNGVSESQSRKLSRRGHSMRRRTAEIQTTWLPDPQYQRDTVEGTQAGLDQDYNHLYKLLKVSTASWEVESEGDTSETNESTFCGSSQR